MTRSEPEGLSDGVSTSTAWDVRGHKGSHGITDNHDLSVRPVQSTASHRARHLLSEVPIPSERFERSPDESSPRRKGFMTIQRFPTKQATDIGSAEVKVFPPRKRREKKVTAKGKSRVTPQAIMEANSSNRRRTA